MTDTQRNEIALLIISGTRANNTTPEHAVELLDAFTALCREVDELRYEVRRMSNDLTAVDELPCVEETSDEPEQS
jgi:hypothetical protein